MPAQRPQYLPGHYYHIYNRGAHRVSIFREEDNYLFVLRKMKTYCRALDLTPIAYCLLPNHYHWLIRQDGEQPAGLLPQRVFNSYSKAYNRRYAHSGTLFEGNYKVRSVNREDYLLSTPTPSSTIWWKPSPIGPIPIISSGRATARAHWWT